MDFTPDGPLCHTLATMYQFKNEQGWRRFDLSSPSRKDTNLEMCQKIIEVLEKKRLHVTPKVFLHKDLSKDLKDKVKDLAKKMKLNVTETEKDATHILHSSVDPDGDMFCKGVFKRADKCMVHFYRMPESHDNWGQVRLVLFFPKTINLTNNNVCTIFFTMEGGKLIAHFLHVH